MRSAANAIDIDPAKLVEMVDAGKTRKEIANKFGCSESTITRHMRRAGIRLDMRKHNYAEVERLYLAGFTYHEIREKVGMSVGGISYALEKIFGKGFKRKHPKGMGPEKPKHPERTGPKRRCRVCGKDPWPNRFFCKRCHSAVSIYVDDGLM